MSPFDTYRFAMRALTGFRVRSALMLLATTIGVASVVMLTTLGEGARRYVTGEFAALGTNLVIVIPGRNETTGGAPPMLPNTTRDLTLEDALALLRSPSVARVAPFTVGSAALSVGGSERDVVVMGATAEMMDVRHMKMAQGRFLPVEDWRAASSVCVLGSELRKELFGNGPVLGEWVRLGDRRFRVIGVLRSQGQSLGVNNDEIAIVPVAAAQALFNSQSLFRIMVEARDRDTVPETQRAVTSILKERHEGEEDVTVITQDSVLATFDKIFGALTLTVAGIASISLLVAGVLIMNVMLVAVAQRTAEIGLLKALGAPERQILSLFLSEATLLAALGGLLGLMVGAGVAFLTGRIFPALPLTPPLWSMVAAFLVALITGALFGVLPARRAARLDPVHALSRR